MKDFLLVLFYQAIVAVNTAVILNAIIWLAKRKEKQEKRPNPDFAPPPAKKPPKPPTTGTNVIEPKDTTFYTLEIRDGPGNPVVATFSAKSEEELKKQIEKLKVEPVTVYNPAERHEKLMECRTSPTMVCGTCKWHDDKDYCHCEEVCNPDKKPYFAAMKRPAKLYPCEHYETAAVLRVWDSKDGNQAEGTATAVVFNRKEGRMETRSVRTTHICRNCKHFLTTDEEYLTGTCGLNEEITFAKSNKACYEPKQKKAEPSCNECRWFVKRRDGDTVCANTGLHISANLKGAHCAMFEPKPSASKVKPVPPGTKTTH